MKLVKFIIVFLVLSLFVSFLSHAEERYKRGKYLCTDENEKYFYQNPQNLDAQYFHFSCEVIKGNDSVGLPELYILADKHSHLPASDFLANYFSTDGRFEAPLTSVGVIEAIKYRLQTLTTIKLNDNYPGTYKWIEESEQIELDSFHELPYLHLLKYNLGFASDYNDRLLHSPSYKGSRDLGIFPEHSKYMRATLNSIVHYAEECANLPPKDHFKLALYKATIESCNLMKKLALDLIPLDDKRQEILLLPNCQDLNKENCPEYHEIHNKIFELMSDYKASYVKLFEMKS